MEIVIKGIEEYLQIKEYIYKRREENSTSSTPGSSASNLDKLAQLKQLKDDGVLNEAEFNAKKEELLKNI